MKLIFLLGIFFTANFVYAMPVKFKINNSKSSKGYEQTSLGAQVDITEKTSIDGRFDQSKENTYKKTSFTLGADHTYSDTYTFFGNLSSSSDSSGIKGFGQSIGSDITLSEYWEGDLSTIATLELARTRYQGQETLNNTIYKTNYIESSWKLGLEQEIVSWLSLTASLKQYNYKDNSTTTQGRRTYADHLSSLEAGPESSISQGVNFYKKDWPTFTMNYGHTKNKDGSSEMEQNYSLLYRINSFTIGGNFTHNKKSTGEVEDTWGPNISTSF